MTSVLETELESDPYLISLVRGGDTDAFGRLYERHVHAARRLALVLTRDPSDADDLVAETFVKLLAAMRGGHGPDSAFRAYLLTTLRRTLYDRAKRDRRVEYTDDLTPYERPEAGEDPLLHDLDSSYAARAFAKLPERWRAVLWHTEVEGESAAQVAPLLGLTPNGVAALAYRARERLRQMYLQEHIAVTDSPRCHWTGMHLAGYVRAALARRDRSKVEDHLAECAECRVLHRELTEENSGLRGVLAGLLLGAAAPGYLSDPARLGLGSLASLGAVLMAWWHAIVNAAAELGATAAGLWYRLLGLPRRLIDRYGPGNVAAAGGLVVAGLAGVGVFAGVMLHSGLPAPNRALPLPAPAQPPRVLPAPTAPAQLTPPTIVNLPPSLAPLGPATTAAQPGPAPSAVTANNSRPVIDFEPAESNLAAAQSGTLPIVIRFAESTPGHAPGRRATTAPQSASVRDIHGGAADQRSHNAAPQPAPGRGGDIYGSAADQRSHSAAPQSAPGRDRVNQGEAQVSSAVVPEAAEVLSLRAVLPEGVALGGPDAGDGWRCVAVDNTVTCQRTGPVTGGRTVARVPLRIGPKVSGYQGFKVTVVNRGNESTSTLRAPIAPAGLRVSYAATGQVGYGLGGNALIACQPRPVCLSADNNAQVMTPALPGEREPGAPAGLLAPGGPAGLGAGALAASGARIAIPAGAAVRWAGLSMSASAGAGPGAVAVSGPGGGWYPQNVVKGFVNVTELVRGKGGGDWWLAARASDLPSGLGQFAGWSLVVVFEVPAAAQAELAVYQGPLPLLEGQEMRIGLDAGRVDLGLVVWDGDQALSGDTLAIDGTTVGNPGNLAGGSNSSSVVCAVAPSTCPWPTVGLDVLRHKGSSTAGGEASLRSGRDQLQIGSVTVLTETGQGPR